MGVGQPKSTPDKKKDTKEGFKGTITGAASVELQRAAPKKVPATNEGALRQANDGVKKSVSQGKENVGASKKKILEQKEALLKKPIQLKSFQIDGITIQRKTEGKKVTFYVGGKQINLTEWIKERTKAREKKQIETTLAPYSEFFKKVRLSEQDREAKLKQLTKRIKARGAVSNNIPSQSAELAQLALETKNPTQYQIKSTLELHYGRVLPPKVDTMIIKRPDGTQIVCMRDDGLPGNPYRDLATLKVVYPQKGDLVDVVRVSPNKAETMAKVEDAKTKRKKAAFKGYGGYTGGGGGYAGGGGRSRGGGGSGGGEYTGLDKSSVPRSSSFIKPPSNEALSKVQIEKTPEGWPKSLQVKHVEMPTQRLYCTLITPKRKPKPGEKIMKIGYLTGMGKSNDYTKWREGPGKMKPPAIVAEAITKKYFSFEAKKAVAEWQAKMAESGVYPVIAFMSEVHTKSSNPGASWYLDWYNPKTVQSIFDNIFNAVETSVPTDSVGKKIQHERSIWLAGHSMGGKALMYATQFAGQGKIQNVQILGTFNSDSTYWNMDSQIFLAKKYKTKLYITTRVGTSTAGLAFRVINSFGLVDSQGRRPRSPEQMRDGLYTSKEHPNVVVKVASNTGHGKHPGFIADAASHIMASNKRVS